MTNEQIISKMKDDMKMRGILTLDRRKLFRKNKRYNEIF